MQAALKGVNFRPAEAKAVVASLQAGDEVTLEREPDNKYDSNAIKVVKDGHHLGFVEAAVAAEIAGRIDRGEEVTAEVCGFAATNQPMLEITFADAEESA